jgi:hypothetical protein
MGFLFKSAKEREREEKRERRKAFRQARRAADGVGERIALLDREARKHWKEAREALQSGEKPRAQRLLTSYRQAQVLMVKLEQKRWVFESWLARLESAESDRQFSEALEKVNAIMEIDPDRVADVFDEAGDLLDEQMESDRFWQGLYEKTAAGAEGVMEDHIPSMEDLEQQLGDEAAAGGDRAVERVNGELDQRIASGRERVKEMLDKGGK